MTWTKTPDDYPDQLLELSDAAYRLHHAATTYANRLGLDGRIPKARLSLVSVPAKTRRRSVIRELIDGGFWEEVQGTYELTDFFLDQLSAEEVDCRREYDAIRQRIRFALTPETKALLRQDENDAKVRLNDARERRRARASQRDSQRDSHRPVPIRSVPSRSAPSESEDENERRPGSTPFEGVSRPQNETCWVCGQRVDPINDNVRVGERNGRLEEMHDSWTECVKADMRRHGGVRVDTATAETVSR